MAAELLYLALQRPNEHILYGDEMGCLAGAWDFSTRSGEAELAVSAWYSPGFSVLLAPILWVVPVDPWLVGVAVSPGVR